MRRYHLTWNWLPINDSFDIYRFSPGLEMKGQRVSKKKSVRYPTARKCHMGKPAFLIIISTQPQPRLASSHSLSFSHVKNTYLAKQTNTQTHTWWSWWDQKCLSGEFVAVRWEIGIISGVHLGAICWLPLRDRRRRGYPEELHSHTDTQLHTHCNAGQFVVAQERTRNDAGKCVCGGAECGEKETWKERKKDEKEKR